MAGNSSVYTNTYTTFSGCDIVCSFGSQVIGELQGSKMPRISSNADRTQF